MEEAEIFIRENAKNRSLSNILVSLTAEYEIIFQRILERLSTNNRPEDFRNYKIRLEQYQEQNDKILHFLRNHIPILEINTTHKTKKEVHEEIIKLLRI